MRIGIAYLLFCIALSLSLQAAEIPLGLDVKQVVRQMDERSQIRAASLVRYTCFRRYQLKNQRFHQTAELSVRMTYTAPGHKTFDVLFERGLSVIRQKVLRRMLEAEEEASRDDQRVRSQITARNYNFELLRSEMRDGRLTYVLDATPKSVSKFLLRGRICVDSEDFAILRVEATPAQKPSALIHNINVVQQYQKIGAAWLPLYNRSMSDSFWFGHTDVSIDSSDYQVSQTQAELPAEQPPESGSPK